jgi:hypothetical protein
MTFTSRARRARLWLAPVAAALVWSAPGLAREVGGVAFAPVVRAETRELALCGAGLLRWRLLKGYAMALYLPACEDGVDPLDDVAKHLELSTFWPIGAERFARTAGRILERSFAPSELDALRGRLAEIDASWRDVRPGDRYALTYVPGRGTTLKLNGDELVTIPGADFARAYFGIWLGERSMDEDLRDALLSWQGGP